jgi:hypothetical protein
MSNKVIAIIVLVVIVVGGVIWYGLSRNADNETATQPVLSVSAFNQTKGQEAGEATASADDIIEFTLQAQNPTDDVMAGYSIQTDISNLSSGATLIDAGGASYNSASNSLVWTPQDIPAHGSIQRKFSVRVTDSGLDSLSIKFNNEVAISLAHPTIAGDADTTAPDNSQAPYAAPETGPALNWALALLLAAAAAVGYGLVRSPRAHQN